MKESTIGIGDIVFLRAGSGAGSGQLVEAFSQPRPPLNLNSLREDGYNPNQGAEVIEVGADGSFKVKISDGEHGTRTIYQSDIL